ncbi:MED6 mediator sub complex component-domain-containing protein [Naematelia encephala]|uniref:Mediator of RNA polymerase II transcription subunit 6 n=1 Tax=Naematelia encephala TaxID=71784 RepID=A0A1Y2AFR4_9TREE|nr:MED6 mediator sub complex component-domain-containing protein [Naematelia encephala]
MAQNAEPDEQDLAHIHWSWPEFIAANPARSLATADLAMDYFAQSPFFDARSNNASLRTQYRITNPFFSHSDEKVLLPNFTQGFEYIIAHSQPPTLFLVHRREVERGRRDNVSAMYFILDGKVYPTPTLYDAMATRLQNAAHLVTQTFTRLSAAHPPANPRATSQWRATVPTSTSNPETEAPNDQVMDIDVPEERKDDTPTTSSTVAVPDWHLFHALASTRNSLQTLDEQARTPLPARNPADELRAIEATLSGFKVASSTAPTNVKAGTGGGGSAVSPSVRTSGTPMPLPSLGGRAPSLVGVSSSPLASWTGTPR